MLWSIETGKCVLRYAGHAGSGKYPLKYIAHFINIEFSQSAAHVVDI